MKLIWLGRFLLILSLLLPVARVTGAAGGVALTLALGGSKQTLTAAELLANPATREIEIGRDVSYLSPMHYRAIPLASLLAGAALSPGQVIEAVASDGFVAMLPLDLVLHPSPGAAEPFIAIEPPDAPWPPLPRKTVSAGPFYLVWLHPEASGIRSEQWPYMVMELRSADLPARRWPTLAVAPSLPADDPICAGQALFATQCLVCHRLNGAGDADVGPDLNLPENPTEYFQADALKRFIRDPSSLRHWPKMQMNGFDKEALSDHEIDLIVDYLSHMAGRRPPP